MERDDIIEYSLDAHHSEEAGVKIRKRIVTVTIILTAITAFEVLVGAFFSKTVLNEKYTENADLIWAFIKYGYIILTVFKARFIVLEFMHLGGERKSFRKVILYPYLFFILYLIFILVTEAIAVDGVNFNP
ncbi:MAG: cytochrome c oxidase subunit 4 [Saprospiraceae bacterium]|jgi:cytochrome c oxidase subunit 4